MKKEDEIDRLLQCLTEGGDLIDSSFSIGDLSPLPEEYAEKVADFWRDLISEMKENGDWSEKIPSFFRISYSDSGNLLLQALSIPSGVIFAGERKTTRPKKVVQEEEKVVEKPVRRETGRRLLYLDEKNNASVG